MPKNEAPQTIGRGEVVAVFLQEMNSAVQELRARREFDEHVGAFLKEKGLAKSFDKFRAERIGMQSKTKRKSVSG